MRGALIVLVAVLIALVASREVSAASVRSSNDIVDDGIDVSAPPRHALHASSRHAQVASLCAERDPTWRGA